MVGPRVAVLGGQARADGPWLTLGEPVFYRSPRDGGNGELRRLLAGIRAGAFAAVVIRPRWNAHAATTRVRDVCRRRGVRVVWDP